jgi:hypothetical protein
MHELAHVIIGHEPARVDVTEGGSLILNTYNREQEDEADWLAGCLSLKLSLSALRTGAERRRARA